MFLDANFYFFKIFSLELFILLMVTSCFLMCIIILFLRVFWLLYLWCCCVHWLLWVKWDSGVWMFLWLLILRMSLMLLLSLFFLSLMFLFSIFYTLHLKGIYILCGPHNYIIDIYIMGMLLKYNRFGVNVTKTKHAIKLHQRPDSMLSKQSSFCGTK